MQTSTLQNFNLENYRDDSASGEQLETQLLHDKLVSLKEISFGDHQFHSEESEKVLLNILDDYSEAKEKAEESTRLKEAFLANISHEIRTPINAIMGFSDILSKRELGHQEKEYIKIIKTAGENLLAIINDILDISKIEAGVMSFVESDFNIREILKQQSEVLSAKAKEKNIQLAYSCDENLPNSITGDPNRLTQIIYNLTDNAIKFTPKGKVKVSVRLLENESPVSKQSTGIDYKKKSETLLIKFTIKDTGIGIAPGKLKHIFEQFCQIESHTTRKYGGTGLGLSIAKRLVELQGGILSVKSELNTGSEFSFCIPYKRADTAPAVPETISKKYNLEELRKLNILLVEDNHLNIKLIQSLFSEYNMKIEVSENGSLGVEKLREGHFDIILMDMEMPVMDGYEATTTIRQELKNNTPIIAITAHAMEEEKEKCFSLGMNDYVSKPIDANLLFEKIYDLTINSKENGEKQIEPR